MDTKDQCAGQVRVITELNPKQQMSAQDPCQLIAPKINPQRQPVCVRKWNILCRRAKNNKKKPSSGRSHLKPQTQVHRCPGDTS